VRIIDVAVETKMVLDTVFVTASGFDLAPAPLWAYR